MIKKKDQIFFCKNENLHQDYSLEIVLVRSYRNQQVNELDPVFEHYREYSQQFFEQYFPLLYEEAFAEKCEEEEDFHRGKFIEHTSISIRVCR